MKAFVEMEILDEDGRLICKYVVRKYWSLMKYHRCWYRTFGDSSFQIMPFGDWLL